MKRVLIACLLLSSCGNPTVQTPAPPNSPQTQVLNIDKTLADSINAAVKTAISLRNQGQVSAADVNTIENWAKAAAILDDQIATELGSADPWTVQKQKILLLLPGFQIPITGTINQTLAASLAAVTTTVNLIRAQVQ